MSQDPKLLIALQIHKGAIDLIAADRPMNWETALRISRDMMQELYPDEHLMSFTFPYWSASRSE